ncbi:serine carboxypeptidase-like 44 [Gossypium hirsutum]|uniref:Serine carboxypeptidase-like 44 n=1 Tax=Gossypium hirsutum TaxID=3635 RepID=A0A1U8KM68_GOSHI|nr:serine carboxypeptidase-like 44 [Gossypium hirsutum]
MGVEAFFNIIYTFIFGGIIGYHLSDQIGTLPGQPNVNFRQFSGYIDVDPNAGRRPGCSSVGDSFVGIGPFTTTNNARGLKRNPYAWTKVSNMLFIDSPIGSGWSYSNTNSDYQAGDVSTNDDLVVFILKWFQKYPIFKFRDLYLGGTSYAGHFVPNLANTLLQCNTESKSLRFNVKGVLGDPLLRYKLDILAEYELYASKGMVPKKLYKQILKHFNGIDEDNYYDNPTIWSEAFQQAMNKVEMIAFNVSSVVEAKQRQFDLFRTPCDGKFEDLYSGKEVTKIMDEVDMCIPLRTDFYFTLPEVQKAFHGNRTTLSYQYAGCFEKSGLNYSLADKHIDMLSTLKQILEQSVPITIFSGEDDGTVPMIGTLRRLKKLANDMNFNLTKNEAWNHKNKEGGWLYKFGDSLTFMSVKGANHHVPLSKPSQALYIFTNHVIDPSN